MQKFAVSICILFATFHFDAEATSCTALPNYPCVEAVIEKIDRAGDSKWAESLESEPANSIVYDPSGKSGGCPPAADGSWWSKQPMPIYARVTGMNGLGSYRGKISRALALEIRIEHTGPAFDMYQLKVSSEGSVKADPFRKSDGKLSPNGSELIMPTKIFAIGSASGGGRGKVKIEVLRNCPGNKMESREFEISTKIVGGYFEASLLHR